MTSNSNVWSKNNNSHDPPNFLRGNPTKTFLPLSNVVGVDLPVDDGTRTPQPIKTAPDPAFLKELNDFRADFDAFYLEFAKFRDTVLQPSPRPTTQAPSVPPAPTTTTMIERPCGSASFQRVIGELDTVNSQFSRLLDQLEKRQKDAPLMHPLSELPNNPQQLAKTQNLPIPCDGIVPPAPAPEQPTAVLGESPWDSHYPVTTIHQVTMVELDDRTFVPLPPPAPDPVDMVPTGALWPQPRPAQKTIPFKKKAQTKHTVVRRRDQDLRPP